MATSVLARALWLHALGLSVIGLAAGSKQPLITWKPYQERHPTLAELLAWFGNTRLRNIGVVTGSLSGIVVVDIDSPKAREAADNLLPPTPWTVRTAKGQHRYFRHPGPPVPNRVQVRIDGARVALDIRGDGGLVVAPGSIHPSGALYGASLLFGIVPVEELPIFDVRLLAGSRPVIKAALSCALADPTVTARAHQYLATRPVPEIGNGSDYAVFSAACALVRGFALSEEQATEALWKWCGGRSGWDREWVRQKVENALTYGVEPMGGRAMRDEASRGRGRFAPIDAATLLANTPADIEWVWDRFLPRGTLSLLAAFMKVGKSTFAYALALAIGRGADFLDHATTQGAVLILAVEEHARDVRRRLTAFGMTPADPIHIHVGNLSPDSANLEEIAAFIREHEITMLLIDTLSSYLNVENENDNAEVQRAIQPLLDLVGCNH